MEGRERANAKGNDGHSDRIKAEATSSQTISGDAMGHAQMPSQEADFAGRPDRTDHSKFLTPKEIGLILRQLGDNLEKMASGCAANKVAKGG